MGKTKKNEEIYSLKKELRECHETIRTLEKELLRFQKEKEEPKLTKAEKKLAKKQQEVVIEDKCPKCDSGKKVYGDLGVREIITCSKRCGYREIVKINGKKEESKKV